MKNLVCIVCPNGCNLIIEKEKTEWKVTGNLCPKGKEFAINEMTNPKRSLCSTVKSNFKKAKRVSVRTDKDIPLKDIKGIMQELSKVVIERDVKRGDIIIENVLNTGSNIIVTALDDYQ